MSPAEMFNAALWFCGAVLIVSVTLSVAYVIVTSAINAVKNPRPRKRDGQG